MTYLVVPDSSYNCGMGYLKQTLHDIGKYSDSVFIYVYIEFRRDGMQGF